MRKLITSIILIMALCGVAQAISLETILLGEPPASAEYIGDHKDFIDIDDPVGLTLCLTAGPDFDNPDNEFSVSGGIRYNLFEFGPTVHFWPGNEDDNTAFGVYCLRHLSYDPVLIGTPFVGFDITVAGKDGDMYAFVSGFDVEIQPGIVIRTKVEYRSFDGALAVSHSDESDVIVGNVGLLFQF